ncbi:anthranilate synthase component I family protein [Psychrobacter sp. A3]|uniref:anthranilate synthase component I family protein n=1 Tax=Psychrobacter sp. A3 TaxID=2992754 RepID=UPI00237B238A|nr:anthranilate synthase component I family protein [Psychrobacter sp. A3]MDE0491848.1 anthranilate synthase component I family protein [Psychrobacter sp. A3]
MPVNTHSTNHINPTPSPATHPSWHFGALGAAELLPKLQRHLLKQDAQANWQLVWLNNAGRPVIGLLPKMAWSVYATTPEPRQPAVYTVVGRRRGDKHAATYRTMSYEAWQEVLIAYGQTHQTDTNSQADPSAPPHYHHGLIGFIGYDIAAHELSPAGAIELAAQPCAVLGHYDIYLTPCDSGHGWALRTIGQHTAAEADPTLDALISCLDSLEQQLSKATNSIAKTPAPLYLQPRWHQHDYQAAFDKTQYYLEQGDCYQINLTQKWTGQLSSESTSTQAISLIDYLPALHQNTQAPFAGYLQTQPHDDDRFDNSDNSLDARDPHSVNAQFELLSCSPELFFTFTKEPNSGKHHIITKPIKGTMPRSTNPTQDNAYKQQLIDSEKDRAENVMIVDLLRNDLGKYAKIGSVKVPKLFAIESFSNVHHMVSTIRAEIKDDTHPLTVLFGSLPAGSITGTPKKRAVEIISELEQAPRGAYCGTMGYMNFDGSGQWNVLIRTLQARHAPQQNTQVNLWAGGGITVASDCDAEYQECLDKVGNLLDVLAQKP